VAAMKSHRAGKLTLRSCKVEVGPPIPWAALILLAKGLFD